MNLPYTDPSAEARRLETVRRFACPDAALRQSLDRLVRITARQFDVPVAVISLVEKERVWFLAKTGLAEEQIDRHSAICADAMCREAVFEIPDALADVQYRDNPLVRECPNIRYYAGAPLIAGDGHRIGTLCVIDTAPRAPLSEPLCTLLSDLAAIVVDECEMQATRMDLASQIRTRASAEQRLAATQQQLELVIEHAPVPIAVFNRNMQYVLTSRRWRDNYGLGDQRLVGRSHYEVFPDIPERWKALHQRCLQGESVKCDLDRFHRADGTVEWLRWELQPWRDEDGAVSGLLMFNENITEQKQAGDELERSRRFLNTILEQVQEGIIACDADGRLTVFNPAAARIHNMGLETIWPDQWAERYHLYEADGKTPMPKERICLFRALNGETVEDEELVIIPEGKGPRTVVGRCRPLVDCNGSLIGAVGSIRDVTEQREIEERERQMQKLEAVGQLTGGLAHDFNNLLAVVIGNLQLVQRAPPVDDKAAKRIGAALTAAQRGADLTSRLMAFARHQRLELHPLDVNDIISGLENLMSGTLGELIRVETRLQEGVWSVVADHGELESALLNLAINARDAMETGGTLTLETRNVTLDDRNGAVFAVPAGDYVRIAVADTGSGMSEEVRRRALDPFFTTKEGSGGSGLGLSIVYGVVKQSGGQIDIESAPGRGATVSLYFPRGPDRTERTQARIRHVRPGSERILVVEDDAAVRDVAVALLQDLGYRTTEAANADEALQQLRAPDAAFDLMLTDVVIPGNMNGAALAKQVKQEFPALRILFTSGYAEASMLRQSGMSAGVDLVRKPFRLEDLAHKVRNALDAEIP